MLVLTRKAGESLYIGDDIKISIVGIDGDKVRVGIEAPESKRVFREELLAETRLENRMAARSNFGKIPAESMLKQCLKEKPKA